VHNSKRHRAKKCREFKKLVEQVHEQHKQQQRQDGALPQQREGTQKAIPEDNKDEELEYQDTKGALKVVYGHSSSDSSTDECHKMLHVKYRGSWDIMSRCVI
jgi:hypothetical protein